LKREDKSNVIADLHEQMGRAKVAILTRFTGLNVEKTTQLRQELRRAEVHYRVVKNTLFRRAIQGTDKENFEPQVNGPVAVAWSETDPVSPARVLGKLAKDWPELQILVASSEGRLWGPAQIQEWISLPTLDELRGRLLGLLQAPASKLARLLVTPSTQLAQVLRLRGEQNGKQS
jgi:large subunit ribosomal protein L10